MVPRGDSRSSGYHMLACMPSTNLKITLVDLVSVDYHVMYSVRQTMPSSAHRSCSRAETVVMGQRQR